MSPKRIRRGAVLLLVIGVGTLLTLVLLGTLQLLGNDAQQLRGQQDRLQARWLAESALERAAAQLAAQPNYSGETWQIPSEQLDGRHAGRVEISVAPISSHPARRLVHVVADFPDHPQQRVRQSRQAVLELF